MIVDIGTYSPVYYGIDLCRIYSSILERLSDFLLALGLEHIDNPAHRGRMPFCMLRNDQLPCKAGSSRTSKTHLPNAQIKQCLAFSRVGEQEGEVRNVRADIEWRILAIFVDPAISEEQVTSADRLYGNVDLIYAVLWEGRIVARYFRH